MRVEGIYLDYHNTWLPCLSCRRFYYCFAQISINQQDQDNNTINLHYAENVSPDTWQDEVKRDQFYYWIYVRTHRADLANNAGIPGMVASVEITTGQKIAE